MIEHLAATSGSPAVSELKILLLTTQMEAGGAQKAMLTMARGLQALGRTVQVVTMYDKGEYALLFQQQYGVDIVNLQIRQPDTINWVRFARGMLKLYRLMRREHFDIVQTFGHYSNIIGPIIAWAAGVRVRVSSQRSSLRGSPRWLLCLDRVVANSFLVQNMVAVSESTRRFSIEAQGIAARKLITIRNGIEVSDFSSDYSEASKRLRQELGLPEYRRVIITVARLSSQKGHHYLLEAIPKVRQEHPETVFLLVGDGDLRDALESQADIKGISDAVRFLGVRRDIPVLLALSDVFVLPSLWEGLPNSVLEAMAMGLPVVATSVDGCTEVISHGKTGLLVPPADAGALSEAICQLLGDRNLCNALGDAAQAEVARTFSEQNSIDSFLALYQVLVGQQKS